MMSASSPESEPSHSQGQHMATISHQGRFWEVYLEFDNDPTCPDSFRGLLSFFPADANDGEVAVRTGTIIIENSYEEALAKARTFEEPQLAGLLRSCLPG